MKIEEEKHHDVIDTTIVRRQPLELLSVSEHEYKDHRNPFRIQSMTNYSSPFFLHLFHT